MESIILAGGCFWSVQDKLSKKDGVLHTAAGYAGGDIENPDYETVCSGRSGHAECVLVEFDESKLSLPDLLYYFFTIHDSTQYHRQGPDIGSQYRSAIFCTHDQQANIAQQAKVLAQERERRYGGIVCTEIVTGAVFYRAEDYHQEYWARRCSR